jgi:hypothetical protein
MEQMFKLLVNTPSGEQAIVEVEESGGYFDSSRIVWDERTDGALPAGITLGGMVREAVSPATLAFDQARMDEHLAALPKPQVVSMRQARLALLAAGKLAAVDAAIAALQSPNKETAQIYWEFSTEVHREHPIVLMLAARPELNLDSAALDALFVDAETR